MALLIGLVCAGFILRLLFDNEALRQALESLSSRVEILEHQLGSLRKLVTGPRPGVAEGESPKVSPAAEPAPPASRPPVQVPVPPRPADKSVLPGFSSAASRPPAQPAKDTRPAYLNFEAPSIDWEKFMGVKLFAWLGGFALFLGMAFFVKYSIDHNLISPLMRVMIGFAAGIGVIVGGLSMRSKGYDVTVQTLCAAGISILYADLYACRSFYNFLSPEAAFPLMILVTVASFFLAVRLDSRYVAILGLTGGFLTPVLLSTGVDRPFALFAYIAMLDIGVLAVAIRKRWGFLVGLSAAATFLMQMGWTAKFFTPDKAEIAFEIYLLFAGVYIVAAEIAKKGKCESLEFHLPGSVLPLALMGFVGYMLSFQALAIRPGLLLTLLLVLSVALAWMAVRFEGTQPFYILGGMASFLLLMIWTTAHLKNELLLWGLGYYLAFAVVHALIPIALQRLKPSQSPFLYGYLAPILMLVLILCAMVFCDILSFVMWPFVFVIGMLAIAVAWFAGSILAAGATLLLIMGSFGVWLFRLPDVGGLGGILGLLGFFSLAFFAWSLLVTRRASLLPGNLKVSLARGISPEDAAQLPVLSALMPFALLAMVCLKLKMADPTQVFLLMAALNVLLLGLARYRGVNLIPLVALLCTSVVEFTWHQVSFAPQQAMIPLVWTLAFYGLFTIFPFLFSRHLKTEGPWIASALSGPVHFWLVYHTVTQVLGKGSIGLIPALFAIPSLMGLYQVLQTIPKTDERRNSLLAWFGGVALLFVTLVIPIQFDKQWLTLGLALEGAALLWLYQRVPHEGLKDWAISLLSIAFVRLALNPAVFSYHPRTDAVLMNWYLFVYGTAAACMFLAANWVKPIGNQGATESYFFVTAKMPPYLKSLGTVLLFLLLNIEIADFFSTGATITFNFSGSFAQDLTYSLAWAVFAIALLVAGIREASQGTRYASLGLLSLTILKVFLHDLWRLGQLFRVASFIGLAVILILVSFLYQRYVTQEKTSEVPRA